MPYFNPLITHIVNATPPDVPATSWRAVVSVFSLGCLIGAAFAVLA